jgi:integrase
MGLYRQKRSKVWWMSLTHNGKRIRQSTETTDKKLAAAILAKVRTLIVEGKWFETEQLKYRTLQEFIDKYVKERSSHKAPKSYVRDKNCFKHLQDFFGVCTLAEINPGRVNEYKQKRLEVADPQTVVKELGLLKAAFNVAIKEWEWCKDNPVTKVSMPQVPPGRVRYLTSVELNSLLDNAEDWFRPILITAVHTGMRKGNLLSLSWDQVDLTRKVIILEKTKNRDRLAIPINDTLYKTLMDLRKIVPINKLVFHREGKPLYSKLLSRALTRALKKSGIENFRFHDIRHTFASLLVQNKTDLFVVQKLLGHRDSRMTQRYAHLAHERLAAAVCNLDEICHSSVIPEETKKELQVATP